jgi:predicted transcriptional regulator
MKYFLRSILKRKSANENNFNKILSESNLKCFIIEEIARKLYNEFVSG